MIQIEHPVMCLATVASVYTQHAQYVCVTIFSISGNFHLVSNLRVTRSYSNHLFLHALGAACCLVTLNNILGWPKRGGWSNSALVNL